VGAGHDYESRQGHDTFYLLSYVVKIIGIIEHHDSRLVWQGIHR